MEIYSDTNSAVASSLVGTAIASGAIANAAPAVMSGAAGGSAITGVLSMQSITALPETDAYMSSEVRESIHDMKGCMMGFDFMKPSNLEEDYGYEKSRKLATAQSGDFDTTENGSSFVNLFGLILVLIIVIPLLNLLVVLLEC